jgi:acid phosphatase type 7
VTDVLAHSSAVADGGALTLALTTSRFAFIGASSHDGALEAASMFASSATDTAPVLKVETDETPTTSPSTEPTTSPSTTHPTTTTVPRTTTTTSPAPTTTQPSAGGTLHVAAVGDVQPSGSSANSSGTAAEAAKADIILGLGDYQYTNGDLPSYNKYFDVSWGANVPKMYPILAPTHDQNWQAGDTLTYWNGGGAHGYKSAVPGGLKPLTPYSFDRNGWHFVALPDACFRVTCDSAAIRTWLQNDLATTPSTCTIAYWHQAYFTSTTSEHGPFDAMASWVDVLAANHVDIVLQGHNHGYARFHLQNASRVADPQGMQAFVVGTGGIGFYPWQNSAANLATQQTGTYGVLDLSLRAGSYDWRFAATSGGSYADSGSMSCR